MFVPFVNADYRNNWAEHLRLDPRPDIAGGGGGPLGVAAGEGEAALAAGAVGRFYKRKSRWYRSTGRLLKDATTWWANGRIVCNEASGQLWGDQFLCQIKEQLAALARRAWTKSTSTAIAPSYWCACLAPTGRDADAAGLRVLRQQARPPAGEPFVTCAKAEGAAKA